MQNVNDECLEIAKLLWIENTVPNLTLPLDKLDYTESSVYFIDKLLLENRDDLLKLQDEDYQKLILRIGCYVGEVIRIMFDYSFDWYSYDEISLQNDSIKKIGKNICTYYVLLNKKGLNLLPIAKVDKTLQNGASDSLSFYLKTLRESVVK